MHGNEWMFRGLLGIRGHEKKPIKVSAIYQRVVFCTTKWWTFFERNATEACRWLHSLIGNITIVRICIKTARYNTVYVRVFQLKICYYFVLHNVSYILYNSELFCFDQSLKEIVWKCLMIVPALNLAVGSSFVLIYACLLLNFINVLN